MAPELRTFFDRALATSLADEIAAAAPDFDRERFVALAAEGLEPLSLSERAARFADAMRATLPGGFPERIAVLLASLPEPAGPEGEASVGMAPFRYWPHVVLVATDGLEHFDLAMEAQHAITQRFTCEFSLGRFVEREPERALEVLRRWARDPSPHVRRLVSEGTRPRLPWGKRLAVFRDDPAPLLELLALLRDDPSETVRRSVANHLNDLSKEHPERIVALCAAWLTPARRPLVAHALRTLVKKGHPGALAVLGAGDPARIEVLSASLPGEVTIGGTAPVVVTIRSTADEPQRLVLDLAVDFVKADGRARPKVFKGAVVDLAPGATTTLRRTISLRVHTTRTPYPGRHAVGLLANGARTELGGFDVR